MRWRARLTAVIVALMASPRKAVVGAGAALGATVIFAPAAGAATFTVTNLDPSGPGSLAQAVSDAEAASDADTIEFQPGLSGTVTLAGELAISNPVTIHGPGADDVTLDAHGASRVFNFGTTGPFEVTDLTLANGSAAGGGGAIVAEQRRDHAAQPGRQGLHHQRPGRRGTHQHRPEPPGRGHRLHLRPQQLESLRRRAHAQRLAHRVHATGGRGPDRGQYVHRQLDDRRWRRRMTLYDETSSVVVRNNVVSGKTSTSDGGGIFVEDVYGGIAADRGQHDRREHRRGKRAVASSLAETLNVPVTIHNNRSS